LSVGERTVSAISAVDLASELIARRLLKISELRDISSALSDCFTRAKAGFDVTEERLSEVDLGTLWALADQRKLTSSLGFEIGKTVNNEARGLLANWVACCDSLGEVFSVFTNNIGLLNESEQWVSRACDTYVSLEFSHVSRIQYPQIAVERSMVALLAWGEYFCDEPLVVESADFSFTAPEHHSLYEKLFGSNLNFGTTGNRIVLDRDILSRPVRSSNRYVRELLAKRAGGVILSSGKALPLKRQVEALLRESLQKYSRLERALDELNISRANLYRKLKAEGTQYSILLREARLTRLESFDEKALSSDDKAEEMGFSDVSSYYRFLKRADKLR